MAEVKVKTADVEFRTTKLTKSLLKQFEVRRWATDYLPGGKEAQDENYQIVGWVHGSVLESDETYWKWLVVQLRAGEYVRIRVANELLTRIGAKYGKVQQIYIV